MSVTFQKPVVLIVVGFISKRHKKQVDLTTEQCFLVFGLLPDPYNKMAFTALCTGLRIEEILALDWKKIDFLHLCMKVEEAVVHGRLGPVKTEYSQNELPLDPEVATFLLDWKRTSNAGDSGLVFPSRSEFPYLDSLTGALRAGLGSDVKTFERTSRVKTERWAIEPGCSFDETAGCGDAERSFEENMSTDQLQRRSVTHHQYNWFKTRSNRVGARIILLIPGISGGQSTKGLISLANSNMSLPHGRLIQTR